MAGIDKFRIPTLDEKEKHKANLTKGLKPLFKNEHKSADSTSHPLQNKTSNSVKHASVTQQPSTNQGKLIVNSKSSSIPQAESTSKTAYTGKQHIVTEKAVSKPKQTLPETGSNKEEGSSNPESEQEVESLPTLAKLGKTNSLIVNQRQRGNPILKHVRNVPWEYGNIVPDYVMGHSTCALFLSLRYHQLNPDYVHKRLKLLGKSFDLRVLLVQVDIKDPHHLLKDLAKMCILADCTLMLAFSPEEAGRYLETYKVYENKPPEAIMEKSEDNFMAKVTDCLTTVKSVNKTDCMTLLTTFKRMDKVMNATREELSLCPGFGPQKAQRLHDVCHEPFLRAKKRKPVETVEPSEDVQPGTSKSAR